MRYITDIRVGCGAIIDTYDENYDKYYQGLHSDTYGVVFYRMGERNSGLWNLTDNDIKILIDECKRLNDEEKSRQLNAFDPDFPPPEFPTIDNFALKQKTKQRIQHLEDAVMEGIDKMCKVSGYEISYIEINEALINLLSRFNKYNMEELLHDRSKKEEINGKFNQRKYNVRNIG